MGVSCCEIACWMTRSTTVGIPSCRTPPSGFGISFRRTGCGLYLPLRMLSSSSSLCSLNQRGASSTVIPSISGRSFVGFHALEGSVQVIPAQYSFKQVCTVRFFDFPTVNTQRSCILVVFRIIPLLAALVSKIFCFHRIDLPSSVLRTYDCSALPIFLSFFFLVLWPLLTSRNSLLLRALSNTSTRSRLRDLPG